jgi:peptide methionine sulfoxide reductase msrA/msrB
MHDPSTKDRQGNDVGSQYRSAAFYSGEAQRAAIVEAIKDYQAKNKGKPVTTEVAKSGAFWSAEEYHQDYLVKNPGGYCHVDLGLAKEPLE